MAKAKRPPQTKKKLGGPRVGEGGPRRDKADAVASFQERVSSASAVLLTEYRGLTVGELAELRASLREADTDYKVYKNTLATIGAKNLGLEELTAFFEGPTAFAFAGSDPVAAAKKLAEFAKKVPALVLKGGILDSKVLSATQVGDLAKLESREVLLAKIAGLFQSPVQQLANLFAAPLNQLGSLFAQLRDKTPAEAATAPAEAPAAEAEPAAEAPAEAPAAEAAPEGESAATEGEQQAEAPAAESGETSTEKQDGNTEA